MTKQAHTTDLELNRLKSCINDLVSVIALPAIWGGGEPQKVTGALLDVLLGMLRLDFAHALVKDPTGVESFEVTRFSKSNGLSMLPEVNRKALQQWLVEDSASTLIKVSNPAGDGEVWIVRLSLGLHGDIGWMVVGSQRADFPQDTEKLILNVAANQAAVWLQESRQLRQQRRVLEVLEQQVSERTRELTVRNEELKREIAERAGVEQRLRQSERSLAEGQRLTKTGSWVLDFTTGTTDWSVETCRIFGFPDPPPSPHYSEFRARVRPEDREAVDRGLRESFETGEPRPLKYEFILPNGVRKQIETISQPVRVESGELKLMGTVMDVTERKLAEDSIRASEQLARGQTEALTKTLDALARESVPDRIVEHVLRTITQQLGAHSSSVWERDEANGLVAFKFTFEDGRLVTKANSLLASISPSLKVEDVLPWPEVFRTGRMQVLEDILEGPEFPWRAQVLAQGVVCILIVPMMMAGQIEGMISIRFTQKRKFRAEELELAQALANQTMLAMQLARLSAQSRDAAVLAERNRLARDIHDTLAQGFTGVIMQLEAAQGAVTKQDSAAVMAHVARAGELARGCLGEARRSVRALRPRALMGGTLCAALDDLLKRMTSGTKLQAEFIAEEINRTIPPDWEVELLHIAQESLTNTIKHAQASRFSAKLSFAERDLRLQLMDDGRGFDSQAEHEGFGLLGMKERVERMAGQFVIRTKPGQGTEILITLNQPG